MVCSLQKYGKSCSQTCGSCRDHEICHHVNGACFRGCDKGHKGILCNEECEPQYHGYNCADNCSTACINQTCDSIDGTCFGEQMIQEKKFTSEDNILVPIIGGAVGVLSTCLLVVVICLVLRRNKKALDDGNKFHPGDSTNCPKDAALKVQDDGNVNNVYQELKELSQPSIYDSLH
ncbi:multiple epidermal growth factor-like domains protein 10 isoform X2 [Ostrea edulis]|nr:multiple epidermal growth factor-like domains protein 10 isoform X2 [Ostrea edulis]